MKTEQEIKEAATATARECAKHKPKSYYSEPFEPHEWVTDAMVEFRKQALADQQAAPKRITVALMRDLEKQVINGDISYSRMIEILNETASNKEPAPDSGAVDLYQMKLDIDHIFESGANEIRVFELFKSYLKKL